eukprot:gene25279-11078_t
MKNRNARLLRNLQRTDKLWNFQQNFQKAELAKLTNDLAEEQGYTESFAHQRAGLAFRSRMRQTKNTFRRHKEQFLKEGGLEENVFNQEEEKDPQEGLFPLKKVTSIYGHRRD